MSELTPLTRDLSVFNKLELEKPPVGVKFLFGEPEGVPKLERTLGLCEMVTEAQKGRAFYAGMAEHECAGPVPLGMVDVDPYYWSGQIGPCLEVFKEARANRRIYDVIPTLERGTCNYTAFAPLDKLAFDPDVLVFTGRARKMEIVLRSMSWTTGQMYEAKGRRCSVAPGPSCTRTSRGRSILGDRDHVRPHRPRSGHGGQRVGVGALGRAAHDGGEPQGDAVRPARL